MHMAPVRSMATKLTKEYYRFMIYGIHCVVPLRKWVERVPTHKPFTPFASSRFSLGLAKQVQLVIGQASTVENTLLYCQALEAFWLV